LNSSLLIAPSDLSNVYLKSRMWTSPREPRGILIGHTSVSTTREYNSFGMGLH